MKKLTMSVVVFLLAITNVGLSQAMDPAEAMKKAQLPQHQVLAQQLMDKIKAAERARLPKMDQVTISAFRLHPAQGRSHDVYNAWLREEPSGELVLVVSSSRFQLVDGKAVEDARYRVYIDGNGDNSATGIPRAIEDDRGRVLAPSAAWPINQVTIDRYHQALEYLNAFHRGTSRWDPMYFGPYESTNRDEKYVWIEGERNTHYFPYDVDVVK